MNNRIAAEYQLEINKEVVDFKIGFKAYAHVEETTGVLFSEIVNHLGSIRVLARLVEGSIKAAGGDVDHDQVIEWIDEKGTDFFLRPIIEALSPDKLVAEKIDELTKEDGEHYSKKK